MPVRGGRVDCGVMTAAAGGEVGWAEDGGGGLLD